MPEWLQDGTGKITGYKTLGGADTVFPFSSYKVQKGSAYVASNKDHFTLNTQSKVIAVLLTSASTTGHNNAPYWDGKQLCDNSYSHGAIIASNRMSVTFISNQSSPHTFNYAILRE